MLSVSQSRMARSARLAVRSGPMQHVSTPVSSRGAVRMQSLQEGLMVPDAFREALQSALKRDDSAASMYSAASSNSSSREAGYSRPESPPAYQRPTAPYVPQAQSATAGPMLQILATALGQSRATLERLQAEEAEIENLIQKERKQVERMEWLLEKVQQDYAYFDQLQKRFEADSAGSNMRHENHGGYNSSSSSSGSSGYDSGSSSPGYNSGSSSVQESYYSAPPASNGSSGSSGSGGGGRFSNYY